MLIIISIHLHKTEDYDSKHNFLEAVWSRKGIFGQVLVHLYDTATDIGVLIEWGRLAYDGTNYQFIDICQSCSGAQYHFYYFIAWYL